jgi:hypothetical protein
VYTFFLCNLFNLDIREIMNRIVFISLLLLTFGLFFNSCEKEGLDEKELLNMINKTDLNLMVMESQTYRTVGGADVKLTIGGEVLTTQTDTSGLAILRDVSFGEATLHITKNGFFDYHDQIEIETDGREGSDSRTVELFSKENSARFSGNVKIQTDLTTDDAEHPVGIKIVAIESDKVVASARTDNNGDFDLYVPVGSSGTNVWIRFPDLEYDQKIAIRLNDTTVVERTAVGTIFRPYEEAQNIESTSNINVEVEDPAYGGSYSRHAYIKSLTVVSGSITDVELGFPGRGYSSWYEPYDINIYASSGSGANIQLNGSNDYYPYYYPLNPNSIQIISGGINYPEHIPNENVYTQTPTGFIWGDNYPYYNARLNDSEWVYPGEIFRVDANYGTGTITGDIQ